ncbi:MAG TPA: TetR/AcrR family transcriptional regulator [Microbacterium sp.]|uniref:TetR/AcrR family transcriptional regulator n=1 Tax=Microbacterium sp. TaxID=51671 RepID=UPI002B5C29A0|nr:TetR/AcrR family transcriptional regulator [Microbacterium sp.]HWI30490.1 TetR/AcrR family transcriptional regulator [Microbacterium sp.]
MTEDSELDLPRGVALAWGVSADPQRGPKREMSVEKIVDAAVELADADGLGAVSMAAVAARLGYTPMSLYRYVSAKDDLIVLMQESATGLPPAAVREIDGWKERLGELFRAQIEIYLRHPWMLDIPISGSPATPNSSAWVDMTLEALEETPLDAEERLAVTLMVTGHAHWYGAVLAGYSTVGRTTGMTPAQITAREAALYDGLISPDEFPALRRAVDAGVFLSDSDPFVFGFERILDGIAAYIDALAAGGARSAGAAWAVLEDADVAADKKYREAQKTVREAEKALRDAQKHQRQALRDARDRLARHPGA